MFTVKGFYESLHSNRSGQLMCKESLKRYALVDASRSPLEINERFDKIVYMLEDESCNIPSSLVIVPYFSTNFNRSEFLSLPVFEKKTLLENFKRITEWDEIISDDVKKVWDLEYDQAVELLSLKRDFDLDFDLVGFGPKNFMDIFNGHFYIPHGVNAMYIFEEILHNIVFTHILDIETHETPEFEPSSPLLAKDEAFIKALLISYLNYYESIRAVNQILSANSENDIFTYNEKTGEWLI